MNRKPEAKRFYDNISHSSAIYREYDIYGRLKYFESIYGDWDEYKYHKGNLIYHYDFWRTRKLAVAFMNIITTK